jgi:hypothetical protein
MHGRVQLRGVLLLDYFDEINNLLFGWRHVPNMPDKAERQLYRIGCTFHRMLLPSV